MLSSVPPAGTSVVRGLIKSYSLSQPELSRVSKRPTEPGRYRSLSGEMWDGAGNKKVDSACSFTRTITSGEGQL